MGTAGLCSSKFLGKYRLSLGGRGCLIPSQEDLRNLNHPQDQRADHDTDDPLSDIQVPLTGRIKSIAMAISQLRIPSSAVMVA
jgi:hypothetical protein